MIQEQGETALMWAVSINNIDAVRMLIEKGADINIQNKIY